VRELTFAKQFYERLLCDNSAALRRAAPRRAGGFLLFVSRLDRGALRLALAFCVSDLPLLREGNA